MLHDLTSKNGNKDGQFLAGWGYSTQDHIGYVR